MSQPRPTAAELIEAVREFLGGELMDQLSGREKFLNRVSVNVLEIVGRQLDAGEHSGEAERQRLADILGEDGDLDSLTGKLAKRLRSGTIELGDPKLVEHLRLTAETDLEVANPRWAVAGSAGESAEPPA